MLTRLAVDPTRRATSSRSFATASGSSRRRSGSPFAAANYAAIRARVIELRCEGFSISRICAAIGLGRSTVHRHLATAEEAEVGWESPPQKTAVVSSGRSG